MSVAINFECGRYIGDLDLYGIYQKRINMEKEQKRDRNHRRWIVVSGKRGL